MSTINKPLPHRPFSLAGDLEKRRQQQPRLTSASHLRSASERSVVPPVPKRGHLVTRSPSPPSTPYYYHHHHAAASDALPSSRPKPSHSFSQSQSRSNPHSSTSDLVPSHLKSTRTPSFWRRHWFVILICFLALVGISVAVGVVLVNARRRSPDAGVYIPPSLASSSVLVPISEASPVGTALLGSATSLIVTPVASTSPTRNVSGPPLPSAAPSKPS